MAENRLTQGAVLALTENTGANARVNQLCLLVLTDPPPPPPRTDVFLIINGITVDVVETGAKGGKPDRIGKSIRSFAGNLRSTQRASKKTWSYLTAPMIAADFASLQVAAPDGSFATCDGASLTAVTTCEVSYDGYDYVIDDASFEQQIQITLVEV